MNQKVAPGPGDGDRDLVLAELEQVLSQGLADSSERQRQLLRYIVTEEAEGRGDRLKAYAIATQVFDRPADFDAQQDAIVRVEVGRLRKSLELYFATAGADDPVRIFIDKGGYRPRFEFSTPAVSGVNLDPPILQPERLSPPRKLPWFALVALAAVCSALGLWGWRHFSAPELRSGPRIAVAPFALAADRDGQGYVGVGLRAEVVSVLSEFAWLTVFPLAREVDLAAIGKKKKAKIDYLLKSSVQLAGDKVVVTPFLVEVETGALRWSRRYEMGLNASEMLAMERDLAARVAADVGQPFGVVANVELTRIETDAFNGDEPYRCHLRAIQFWSTYRREDYGPARQCADQLATGAGPNVQAMRAILLLDAARLDYDPRPRQDVLAEAATLAAEAYRRSEKGALPRAARYSTALCQGEIEIFKRVGLSAVRDYPNNPATLLDVGAKLALGAGDWEQGAELVARGRALSGYVTNWFEFADVVDSVRRNVDADVEGLHAAALDSAHPLLLVVDAAVQSRLHNEDARRMAMAALARAGFDGPQAVAALIERQCWSSAAKNALAGRLTAEAGQ